MTERPKDRKPDEGGLLVGQAGSGSGGESVDERFARLAAATADVHPSAELTDWVLDRVDAEKGGPVGIGRSLWRTGRVALAGFAVAAAVCVIWAMQAETSLDEGVLATFDVVELEQ